MDTSRREKRQAATRGEILSVARRQMAHDGTASLSLRGIAREMNVTAPALYRYFNNRDELVTALIVEAFTSLAQDLETAGASQKPQHYAARFQAVSLAYREWAVAHPADYLLIFGTPIPGYHAPAEITTPLANRSINIFVQLMSTALESRMLVLPPEYTNPSPELKRQLSHEIGASSTPKAISIMHFALAGWSQLHGLVTLELFHQIPAALAKELYLSEVATLKKRLGLSG